LTEGQAPVLIVVSAFSNYLSLSPCQLSGPKPSGGMVQAFDDFGCIAGEVWWVNPKTVVTRLFQGRLRQLHPRYAALSSHYAFDPLFCLPAHGNEKPHVENRVKSLQRRWATPCLALPTSLRSTLIFAGVARAMESSLRPRRIATGRSASSSRLNGETPRPCLVIRSIPVSISRLESTNTKLSHSTAVGTACRGRGLFRQ
jgi:hypothetical protein